MIDWFKNENWSNEIEVNLFNQLTSKSNNYKLDILKIQSDIWLKSSDLLAQNAGIRILEYILTEFAEETFYLISVREILSEYYIKKADFETAEKYLIQIIDFYSKNKRIGIIRKADLQLAEIILLKNQVERFSEALELIKNYEITGGDLSENEDKFSYYELTAQLENKIGNKIEARKYALKAIEIYIEIEKEEMLWLISKPESIDKFYEKLPDLSDI